MDVVWFFFQRSFVMTQKHQKRSKRTGGATLPDKGQISGRKDLLAMKTRQDVLPDIVACRLARQHKPLLRTIHMGEGIRNMMNML